MELRRKAKEALKYPPVRFNDRQREAVAYGFSKAVADTGYRILACCIGFDHAHLAIVRHDREIAVIAGHLKSAATRALTDVGLHPLNGFAGKRGGLPTPWSEGCWKVFLDDHVQLSSAISYIQRHPEKEGLAPQNWDFVRS